MIRNNSKSKIIRNSSDMEFTTFGFYEPGFIHLRVNTPEDLSDLGRLSSLATAPEWTSTFLHEYVHFLQDITTTQGLLHFIHAIERLRNLNKQIAECDDDDLSVPVTISNNFNWQANARLKSIYRGCDEPVEKIQYKGFRRQNESLTTGVGGALDVSKFYVDYFDEGAQTDMTCHFGSIHLKEYMAHAIQKQFDPAREHDDIPYRLVELLVASEVPVLCSDEGFIIALCDAALMDYHPAKLFFHTIERIKKSPAWKPANVESVYEFTYKGIKPEGY